MHEAHPLCPRVQGHGNPPRDSRRLSWAGCHFPVLPTQKMGILGPPFQRRARGSEPGSGGPLPWVFLFVETGLSATVIFFLLFPFGN